MFYLYINNDKLKAMFAKTAAKKISVKSFYSVDFPSEFLNDPSQANVDLMLTEALLDLIRKNEIKAKSVKFILDNSKIPFREMILPYNKPSVLMPIIQGELFSDKKLADAHTVDYIEIERNVDEEKRARFLVTYLDNLIIKHLKKCSRDVGMRLTSIDIVQNALSKLVYFMRESLPQYFMLVDYRLTTVTSYLFADYKHVFSLSKPIYSIPNENYSSETAFFINDFSNIVSEAVQFFHSKYEKFTFSTVYVTGDTDVFAPCEQQTADYLGIDIRILQKPDNIDGLELHEFNSFSPLIGGSIEKR